MKVFGGFDTSLTGSGIVVIDEDGKVILNELIKTTLKTDMEKRLAYLTASYAKIIENTKGLESVYIEGPSYGSVGTATTELAALFWMVRSELYFSNIPFKVIAPTALKKFITGKGNSKKELMLKEVYKRWGFDTDDNNIADAYSLAQFALHDYLKRS